MNINPNLKPILTILEQKYKHYKNYDEIRRSFLRVLKRILQYFSKRKYNSYTKEKINKLLDDTNERETILNEITSFLNNYFDSFIEGEKVNKSKIELFLKKRYPLLNLNRDNLSSVKLDAKILDDNLIISLRNLCSILKINPKILEKYFLLNPVVKSKFLSTDNKLSIIIDFRLEFHNIPEIEDILHIEKLIAE